MNYGTDQLYNLLPSLYRLRDAEVFAQLKALIGSLSDADYPPLKALISVLAEQAAIVEEDITGLYENWFIETCEEWLVPYIGDLLGVRGLYPVSEATFSQRARVANTLGYRRRKGTATMLEQLARDTTGWNARVVEFFELLEWTQYGNHVRLHSVRTPDLRKNRDLELLFTAFDRAAHTVDVRHICSGRGKQNIPNIGVYLWRLQSYFVTRGDARAAADPADGRFTFHPVGLDAALFNRPQTEATITHLAEEINVPDALRRRVLYDDLEALRQAVAEGRGLDLAQFGDQPVFEIYLNGSETPLLPQEILTCHLEDWHLPPDTKRYTLPDGTSVDLPIKAAVDPILGRLTLPASHLTNQVQVSFAYGFSGDIGGGPYDRNESVARLLDRPVDWQVVVTKGVFAGPGSTFSSVGEAVKEWNQQPAGTVGVIAIRDSHSYREELTGAEEILIPEGSQLLILAAEWPAPFANGQVVPEDLRPHLRGNLSVRGTAANQSQTPGTLAVSGLLIEGQVTVDTGNLGRLTISHCTLVPNRGGVRVVANNSLLKVELESSICGPVALSGEVLSLEAVDSLFDGIGGSPLPVVGTAVRLERCTIIGRTRARTLEASDCIFTDLVTVERRQTGCVRFSFVPDRSVTPRRFRCQPDLEVSQQWQQTEREAKSKNTILTPAKRAAIRKRVLEWLLPTFTSRQFGQPAYAQLSLISPAQIRNGADDGSEMGVFSSLKQPQREANLRASLDEYLRVGLEAGIFYVT